LKAVGNNLFKAGEYVTAAKEYKEALSILPLAPLHTNRVQ
jgi:hypothetical protein